MTPLWTAPGFKTYRPLPQPRRHRWVILTIIALLTIAQAPAQPSYAPPDAELWRQMKEAIATISMPLAAHQQIQQIMTNVEQQARINEARLSADKARKEPAQ